MKAVQLLVNSVLPEDLRNYGNKYDVKDLNKILYAVAQKHPDKFAEVEKSISDLGRKASYLQGATITLKDLEPVIDKKALFANMQAEIKALPKDKDFKKNRRAIFAKYNDLRSKSVNEVSLKNRNNIAMAVLSGARGKAPQLKAMIGSPWQFSDYKGEPVDVISKNSFAEGVDPTTFLASTSGARASVISTKCLSHDTEVRMADLSVRKISSIRPGEYVLGADVSGNTFPVEVLNVFDQGEKGVCDYEFALADCQGSRIVTATKEHKFLFVDDKGGRSVRPIGEADKNTLAVVADGSLVAVKQTSEERAVHCYDIEVDHPDHLFVLANGVITSNSATAKGGDLAKQFASTSVDVTVREEDCHTNNGLALDIEDKSLVGRALATDVGGHRAGEFITSDVIRDLRKKGVKSVVARSPLTCHAAGGVCAHCVGKFFNGGKLPRIGDAVGLMASSASMEPVTQMALCLEEHTPVRMADGTEKEIKDIVVGDFVLGADADAHTFPVEVLNVFDQGEKGVCDYEFSLGSRAAGYNKVTATKDHKFLISNAGGEWSVRPIGESDENTVAAVVGGAPAGIKQVSGQRMAHCYDIEVDHPDHLFVLANGVITSNSAKHTAGMTSGKKTYAGIPVITQFTQSPEKYKDKAVVSEVAGRVEAIEDAEQGGTYITVNGKRHYVQHGHAPEVKVGDEVEAGDFLSEGLPDIEDVVRLKGLGAGRKLYANRLNQILEDSGTPTDPRNTEILARGALRHVRVTSPDGFGNYLPDDVIDYDAVANTYRMPESTRAASPASSRGKYLQQPFLHYTIGTKLTPKVAKDLREHGYDKVFVSEEHPSFEPEMIRLRSSSQQTRDWLASMGTSYLTQQLNESATRGDDTNVLHNPDYRPRIAYGAGFGKDVRTTGEF